MIDRGFLQSPKGLLKVQKKILTKVLTNITF